MKNIDDTRWMQASRRAFLRRSAIVVVAPSALLAACGTDDEDVFAQDTSAPSTTDATTTTADASSTTDEPATTEATSEEAATTTEADPAPVAPGPALEVAFTYTMAEGGKQLNPYVAVWIEDANGALLRTVELWYEQSRKGPNWLDDLRQWWRVDQDRIGGGGDDLAAAISSATRAPGSYVLMWDGLDDLGQPVAQDSVVVCVESSRERGPTSFVSETVARTALVEGGSLTMPADGELSAATVRVV